jgi:ketosteroid isomerase-like protein
LAKTAGLSKVTMVEFGVAEGTGLMNLCTIAKKVSVISDIDFEIVGFDTGVGMPPARDYRDHPDLYQKGDFPMKGREALEKVLPPNARIIFGQLSDTVPAFIESLSPRTPLGFVVIDVDYFSSATMAFRLLTHPDPNKYLPLATVYVDNVLAPSHNDWCGELLAVREFNDNQPKRKLARDGFIRSRRIFKNAIWLDQMFLLHMFDHPSDATRNRSSADPGGVRQPLLWPARDSADARQTDPRQRRTRRVTRDRQSNCSNDDNLSQREPTMGATENKELIRNMFAELSKGNGQAFLDALSDDVRFTIIGTSKYSGTFNGKQDLITRLLGPLGAQLEGALVITPYNFVAEGDHVAMQSHGKSMAKNDKSYNNNYCHVFRIAGGKVQEVVEYLDTELITAALGK